ncbi:ATP-binding protein [Candidatus Pacearchaeota archaeon]|nr:ATP-binding protein [Candidatus Pacearchaeota archaeon]
MAFDVIIGRNESDKKAYGKNGLAYIGKSFVTMGNYTSISNPIYMDVARTHVVLICGKRGSGKSYTMGAMAESLSDLGVEESGNIASVIFDTMGIYWTMKYKNTKDEALLMEWGLDAKNVPTRVFVPFGHYQEFKDKGIEVDSPFAIKLSDLDASDWVGLFDLPFTNPIAIVIESVISTLTEKGDPFGFKEINALIKRTENVSQDNKNAAMALFDAAKTWKVFDEEIGTTVKDMISAGQTTIIDLSMYAALGAFNVRALIIGLVSKKIFNERMASRKNEEIQAVQHGADYARYKVKRDMPLVWIFIDEAHEFLPVTGKTPATDALVQLLREGRQPGISLVVATQQPGKIHTDAITQADIVMSHKITAKLDVDALNAVTQSYMSSSITDKINGLPKLKGAAIILDDSSERIYPMRVRPRFTWHGGEAPTAIRKVDVEV